MHPKQYSIFSLPVLVGALGFFVDIYDLLLFSIVRRSSFADLGVAESAMKDVGESIISYQMIGLTIGGILWGIRAIKKAAKVCCLVPFFCIRLPPLPMALCKR